MSAARTATVQTTDQGPVTLTEPSWCVGHADHRPVHREDIVHRGPDAVLAFRGRYITEAARVQQPFAPVPADRTPRVSVSTVGLALDGVGLYELAAALDAYADQLRGLADALAEGGTDR
ncbi:DUF6907 domain-containing protein [Streptomyces violaceoruber]|uniref:Uncharacterized protein n=1 Tax=Streptomyces violaceoruber TaxID=1935 RepID=A0ACD4WQI8_STRVN|nr:hypothetical protein R2E43_20970 [Streptomyces violaceoruber]BDD72996.1 hypothetical protein JCM4020_36160 [Streptomyces coelicolor]